LDSDVEINIAAIVPQSKIYGPGSRFVIWVQGCSLGCPGCWNPQMHSHERNNVSPIRDLVSMITAQSEVEGITILGGEPLEQCDSVLALVREVKSLDLTVMLYTGFEPNEVRTQCKRKLVQSADVIVFGRYREDLRSTYLLWRGSSNQRIEFHNERYRKVYNATNEMNQAEIHISEDGSITVTGYPDHYLLKEVIS